MIISNNISRVIGIGETISNSKINSLIALRSIAEFISNFDKLSFANETILIKGARSQFEEILLIRRKDT
jgi:alanine racemase